MTDGTLNNPTPQGGTPAPAAPDAAPASAPAPVAPGVPPQAAPAKRRASTKSGKRRWVRLIANLMIVGGVLAIPGYFAGTCACTALEQNRLRDDLEASHPQLVVASAALESGEDFVPMEIRAENVVDSSDAAATAAEQAAAEEAAEAAEAERQAQLAAFRAAADEFSATVSGVTGEPIGQIVIPSIGVDVIMVEGTSVRDLKEGPGHWSETPFPGQGGNFVVSGHRTTYGAPFFKLNELKAGDEIDLVLPYAVVRYTVTEVFIVYPDEVETVAQRGREQISLAACHPIYSAKQRIVAQGDLTSFKLVEPAD